MLHGVDSWILLNIYITQWGDLIPYSIIVDLLRVWSRILLHLLTVCEILSAAGGEVRPPVVATEAAPRSLFQQKFVRSVADATSRPKTG